MKRGLAIDGGGLFGIGPAAVLAAASPSLSRLDFVAGTSVGGILAAMVSAGVPPESYTDLFAKHGDKIFPGYWWRHRKLFTPKYPDDGLNEVLQQVFGTRTFGEARIPTFITGVDLNGEDLRVFFSEGPDADMQMWEVVRSTVAAPTYFAPWKGVSDGGIMANNPSMVALAGLRREMGVDTDDVSLFSLGTGLRTANTNTSDTGGWSLVRWGTKIIQMLLSGSANGMHGYFARSLIGDRLLRHDFPLRRDMDMDDPAIVKKLLTQWNGDIDAGAKKLIAFLA